MSAQLTPTVCNERLILHQCIPLVTPLVVYVEPSGYCNLQCSFCPHGFDGGILKKEIMLFKLFKKMIDDLSVFPDQLKLLRICGNGDPLVNKEIAVMMQYAQERKVTKRIELVTNAVLLTDNLIENLPRFVDRLVISIEGLSSDDYQHTCNTQVNFEELVEKIKALYAFKKNCIVHIKIHNEAVRTERQQQMFMDLFEKYCDEIYIEQLVPMWPQLNIDRAPDKFRWGGDLLKHRICAQIFKGIQVQADGEVVPCCVDWKRINVLGNIKENSLHGIWNSEQLRALQIGHLLGNKNKTEPCRDCTMNDYCEVDNIDAYAAECVRRLNKNDNFVVE